MFMQLRELFVVLMLLIKVYQSQDVSISIIDNSRFFYGAIPFNNQLKTVLT